MKKFLIFAWLIPVCCFGKPCIDINFTPYAGAENIISIQNGLERIENLILPLPKITLSDFENKDDCPYLTTKAIRLRQVKTLLLGIPINSSCVATQHEIFGHGYRVRDLGDKYAKVKGYKIFVIGGLTNVSITDRLTTSQNLTIDIAGVEADAILANRVRMGWLERGKIDGRQGLLYFMSSLSLTGYAILNWKMPNHVSEAKNDISSFVFFLNKTYQNSRLSIATVRNLTFFNLLDPFLFLSFFSHAMYDVYCVPTKLFMFSIGPVQYLPSIRTALTPFGMQGYLENFFVVNSIPTYLYLKWGKNGSNTYWGVGVENQKVFNWKTGSLGFRLDFWNQPHVLFQQGALSVQQIYDLPKGAPIPELYPASVLQAKSIGVAFSMISSFGSEKWPFRFFSEIGYKTAGYLPGEALRESPIARGGLSGQF